jgi:hypothetical protein
MALVKIMSVLAGPMHSSEVPDWDGEGEGFILLCNIWDVDLGRMEVDEIVVDTLQEAYDIIGHFMEQLKPFMLDLEDEKDLVSN